MTFRSKTMKEVKIDQVLNEEAKNCNSQQEGMDNKNRNPKAQGRGEHCM